MQTNIILDIDHDILGHPWPDGVPVPVAGDTVLIMIDNRSRLVTISSRLFSIGTDPRDGTPLAEIHLQSSAVCDPEEEP